MNEGNNVAIKLPFWKKVGYGFGEAGSQLSFTLVSSYLTVFYTDVVGLTPAVISAIMLIARIWDAINDPMFGSIAENTKSRWGRFRPYILFGSPILALFNCLTFLNLDISDSAKAFWCAFTYIGCGMAYTAVNISSGCLANSLTSINTERVKLNAYRGIVGGIAGLIMSACTMPLILYFGNGSTASGRGYFLTALIYSIASIPCFLICVGSTKEIIGGGAKSDGKKESTVKNLINSFKLTFKDRNAAMLIIAMIFFLTGIFGRLGIMSYYFIYCLGDSLLMASFATAMTFGSLLVNFYAPFFLNRFDKKWIAVASCICQAACCTGFYFAAESGMKSIVTVIAFLYGATNMAGLVSYGLGAEIIDDNWLRTGVRSDGVIYSCISFSTKLGNAIGGSIGILVLGAVGYVANAELSQQVLTKMNAVINFGPVIFFLIAAVFFAMNQMTNQRAKENEAKIAAMTEK